MRMSVHTWPGSCAGRTYVKCAESPVFTCWPDTNWVWCHIHCDNRSFKERNTNLKSNGKKFNVRRSV